MALSQLTDRLIRRARQQEGRAVLGQKTIYIPPTSQGVLLAAVLMLMLLGAINYNNSLAFMLTFLLGSTVMVSILHTFRNLSRLSLRPGASRTVFVGEQAPFTVYIDNPTAHARHALTLQAGEQAAANTDIPAGASRSVTLHRPAMRRGWQALGQITLATRYPLGLFLARAYVLLDQTCLVYPAPANSSRPLPEAAQQDSNARADQGSGREDFIGFRAYTPGDSARHIHWKAVARNQELVVKQFAAHADGARWLDWRLLPELPAEARLSQLCRWVLDAESQGLSYGLRLPDGTEIPPGSGHAQRERCLTALALFGIPHPEHAVS